MDGIKLELSKVIWPLDLVFGNLRRHTEGRRFIAGGDLNAALLFDEVYWPRGNAEWFGRVGAAGWVDCRARFYDDEQQTFFRKGTGQYQLDHLFVDQNSAAALLSFTVLDGAESLKLSDHAPIQVGLDV